MLKSNLNRIILCATAKKLVAGIWHGDQLQQHDVFLHDASGKDMFAAWLAHYPNIPIYLIANAVEEDYRLESLPHSSGLEKNELIARKLNQYYRGLIFRTAHFIQREKDKRKDDKFLFVALNNDEFLQSWINIIQQADAPLVGVYLLPMLSQILCRQSRSTQKLGESHILLCEKLSSGLRQTYLHNGRLRMSRLIPNVPEEAHQLAYFYLVETQKTRLYLMSKRFISREVTLNLQLVSLHDDMQDVKKSFNQEPGIACETLNLSTITKQMHINPQSIESTPELLHMQLLANGYQVDNLAPKALTRNFQLSNISLWLKKFSLAVGLVGLAVSAYFVLSGFEYKTQFENAEQATQMEEQRYQEAASTFPKTPLSAQDLKTAVLLEESIQHYSHSPKRLMHVLSQALESMPEVTLLRLRWVQTNDLSLKDENDSDGVVANLPPENLPNTLGQSEFSSNVLTEIGFISAEIAHFNGNYRDAMQKVQQFSERLKLAPEAARVEILQAPINLNSYSDLNGSTANSEKNALPPALFKIKLQLKPQALTQP